MGGNCGDAALERWKKWRMCRSKRGYATREQAMERAMRLSRKKWFWRAYKCPHCPLWHLTSKEKKPREHAEPAQGPADTTGKKSG